MAKVSVSRDALCELVGLPGDADEATLQRAVSETLARQKSLTAASAAEQQARAEDRRLVNAAHNDGRILDRDKWISALAADRTANRQLLASLAAGLPPRHQVTVDAELENTHRQVLARLGIRQAPRTVAAAAPAPSGLRSTGPAPSGPADDAGIPLPSVPAPVRLASGRPPEEWTDQEVRDAHQWRLGPAFRHGLKPPPGAAGYYQPSPNDVSSYREDTGEWRSKDGWEHGTHGVGI